MRRASVGKQAPRLSAAAMGDYKVANCPDQSLAFTNCVFISQSDFAVLGDDPVHIELKGKGLPFVYRASPSPKIEPGCVGLNSVQRRLLEVSLNDPIAVAKFDERAAAPLAAVTLDVDYIRAVAKRGVETLDGAAFVAHLLDKFAHQYLATGQLVAFEFNGENYKFTVADLELVDGGGGGGPAVRGLLSAQTQLLPRKAAGAALAFSGLPEKQANSIFRENWNFEQVGIGGLDAEFSSIFRRAFASRIFPASVVKKLGVKHVKGMLLYGPPGTGKTLIARQIGKMLNGNEPKIVNGPEVLSKYVGQSEENVRALFADAEAEMAERGDDSNLHIIIFDEIDSICKQRGSNKDGTGVHDTVVNQLLSKIDGVNSLNNILIIGMTNRKDMIDEALLRPGRLEVQVEISLPDEAGRQQILTIHTGHMRAADSMAADVSLPELAGETKNFSGAEIEGLVKSATSFAFARHLSPEQMQSGGASKIDVDALKVMRADFVRRHVTPDLTPHIPHIHTGDARRLRPRFGGSEARVRRVVRRAAESRARRHRPLRRQATAAARERERPHPPAQRLRAHLAPLRPLRGAGGRRQDRAGRVDRAAVRVPVRQAHLPRELRGDLRGGQGDGDRARLRRRPQEPALPRRVGRPRAAARVRHVTRTEGAVPSSLALLTAPLPLYRYVRIGPRFSNVVLQTLLVCIKKVPQKGKLVILATAASAAILQSVELLDAFNVTIDVPALGHAEAMATLQKLAIENAAEVQPAISAISGGIPIKKLLLVLEMSLKAPTLVDAARFTTTLQEAGLLSG